MTMPNPGDRIEHWLLTDDSPIARQMHRGHVEEWDPDAEFEHHPEWRAAWEADPVGQFRQRFGTRVVDALLAGTGTQVTTVYEMVACLPSEDSDSHSTWRILMKIKSREGPFKIEG